MTVLYDFCSDFKRVLSVDSTDTAFVAKVPTTTEPKGAGVLDLIPASGETQFKKMLLVPYGSDADDKTFQLRVIGWRLVGALWVPVPLCQLAVTMGNITGVAASDVLNTSFFADTLVVTTPASSTRVQVTSPGTDGVADVIAHSLVDLEGFRKVEITFNRNSSATAANALYAML